MLPPDPYHDSEQTTLPNGLTVTAKTRSIPWIYVGFVCHVGAREDPMERAGMAHLVEHLLSKNLEGWTSRTLDAQFKQWGGSASFGRVGYLSSSYSFFLPTGEHLREALSLFGQMLLLSRLTWAIEEEKAVITREWARDYPRHAVWQALQEVKHVLFEGHPRLSHFVCPLGNPEEFRRCQPDEVQAFSYHYYVPANLQVVSVGGLSLPKLVQALEDSPFSSSKPGRRHAPIGVFVPPRPRRQEIIVAATSGAPVQVSCTYRWVLPPRSDRIVLWVFSRLLETRLLEVLRYEHQLTYTVSVSWEEYQDCYALHIRVQVPPDAIDRTERLLWQVLATLDASSFEQTQQEMRADLSTYDCSDEQLLEYFLTDLEDLQRLASFTETRHQVEQTTFAQIQDVAHALSIEQHVHTYIYP